ncbi:MAG TPA: hypothetical protein VH682_24895, partial [Gemmataceae bacterium]
GCSGKRQPRERQVVGEYVGAEENLYAQKKKWRDIRVKRATVVLDEGAVKAVAGVWRLMLLTVRYLQN